MAAIVAEHELYHSCRVLFGTDMQITRSFLEYLQPSGIKSAYRKKALETHPDIHTNKSEAAKQKSNDLFHVVQQAYETLTSYLDAREHGFSFQTTTERPSYRPPSQRRPAKKTAQTKQKAQRPTYSQTHRTQKRQTTTGSWQNRKTQTWQRNGQTKASTSSFSSQKSYQGAIPTRKLLFGHYLYYCGIANWHTIIKALVWQRTQRPRVGEIGKQLGWLDNKDILTILRQRNLSDSFGKSAVSLGLLTERQLRLIIYQQKKLQNKFGQYFTHNKILTPSQLNQLIRQFESHNSTIAANRYAYKAGYRT